MPRFFVRQEQIEGDIITLTGDDAHHVARSLRMAVGDAITVCDMQATEYDCRIVEFASDRLVTLKILSRERAQTEPPMRITLLQALPKGDKLDTVIQKAVECGASEIVPFESERCVARVKQDAEERKTERRQRIALEAAKQSGRSAMPVVRQTVSFERALDIAKESQVCLFCYEGDGTQPIGRILRQKLVANDRGEYPSVAVIIGSEGGFSQREAACADEAGLVRTGLGVRILRAETAPIFALSCVVCFSELMD